MLSSQDLIDIWLKVQGMWQYLEPIFGSEDIMRQMPTEGALFKKQDALWRDNGKKVKAYVTEHGNDQILLFPNISGFILLAS